MMSSKKYQQWIEEQLIQRGIKDKKILDVFSKVNREKFISENLKYTAYQDSALPLGYEQTISQPYVVALMTQLLNPKKTDVVLEVGSGSGYQSAILSKLVKKVISLEIIEKLAEFAKENIKKNNINNVEILHKDATIFKKSKYFDKIIVTAATKRIPQNWIDLLKEGGEIVLPEKKYIYTQQIIKYKKLNNKLKLTKESIPVVFVPLTGKYS